MPLQLCHPFGVLLTIINLFYNNVIPLGLKNPFMEKLMKYKHLKFKFYDFDIDPELLNEK